MDDAYGIHSLRNAVKANKITGVTDADIDQLFDLYWKNNYENNNENQLDAIFDSF